ncbi:MAG: winged helix-turn-helix domain-containing protein [Chloroflexi bacterium]|nr:winged helix-turn-helix domain-containing protein [Chloroflexota bacterium]
MSSITDRLQGGTPARGAAARARVRVSLADARRIWLRAQRLDVREPFGAGPDAAQRAIEHLGYVQIDTINVIERCHHHILWSRIPRYRRADLAHLQSDAKSVFEYWTHALAYLPIRDFPLYLPQMRRHRREPRHWGARVDPADYRRVLRTVRSGGALTIRDIDDDVLVEKEHLWASRKPSKAALQLGFWNGVLSISARTGMLKTYELTERHFGWRRWPAPATERQVLDDLIDAALRTQGIVSVASIRHTRTNPIGPLTRAIAARVRRGALVPVELEGAERLPQWAEAATLDAKLRRDAGLVHVLSPFDPLVRQRGRTELVFGYRHLFEAYVPEAKRRYGYFTLPVLVGDRFEALLDLKTDRAGRRLLVRAWHWLGKGSLALRARIEDELHRLERFQVAGE